jgi:hypothetical protein
VLIWAVALATEKRARNPEVWVWIVLLLASPALIAGTLKVWESRDEASWSSIRWLPLRGRWLCYFVTALCALPSAMAASVVVVALFGLLALVLVWGILPLVVR